MLFLIFTLLLLGCGQHQLTIAMEAEVEKLFDIVDTFVPTAEILLETAADIWNNVELFRDIFNNTLKDSLNKEIFKKINMEIDKFNLVDDKMQGAKTEISQESLKDYKILEIHKILMKVFSRFRTFATYVSIGNIDNDTLTDFYQAVIGHSDRLTELLDLANNLVKETKTNTDLKELISDPQQSIALMCKMKQSPMQVLTTLYNEITSAELKAMILVRYAYLYLHKDNYDKYKDSITAYDTQVKTRLDNTRITIKYLMQFASREFWTCSTVNSHAKLGRIFYIQIIPEEDIGEESVDDFKSNYFNQNCAYFRGQQQFADLCLANECKRRVQCEGYIRDCFSHDKNSTYMEVCHSNYTDSLKYGKVQVGGDHDNVILGENTECDDYDREVYVGSESNQLDLKHEICMCTCSITKKERNYFSSDPVVSDIHQNKVITGVQIELKGNVFTFVIQEAIMTKFANINQTSVKWQNLSQISINEKITDAVLYDWRTINLDVLESPPNTVLTGLRFGRKKTWELQLEIRYTPFNIASGKLDQNLKNSKWILPEPKGNRPEIKFNTKLPKYGDIFSPDTRQRAYLNFTTSSLEEDIGQTVVPFIDTSKVETSRATPLSGAGLIYKGSPLSAGFLSTKIITYNFEPHLLKHP